MKKSLSLTAIFLLALFAVSASAQLTATSGPVQVKAIVPEFIGLYPVATAPVVFNVDSDTGERLAQGQTNLMSIAPAAPTWTMSYNLSKRTVTVCAYATDLIGVGPSVTSSIGKIPAAFINGTSVQAAANTNGYVFFGSNASCTNSGAAAVLLDKVVSATSSYNTEPTHSRPEGFSLLQINVRPGNGQFGSTDVVPAPGTYLGTLYVVAQAI